MSELGDSSRGPSSPALVRTPVDPAWPAPSPWAAPQLLPPVVPGSRRRSGRRVLWIVGGALVLVFAVAAQFANGNGGDLAGGGLDDPFSSPTPVATTSPSESGSISTDAPPDGVGETPRPTSLPTGPVPAGSSRYYSYIDTQSDAKTPVTWSPCRAIHYVVRTAEAPAGSVAVLRDAVAELSHLTGLTFVDDGSTTEPVATDRDIYQEQRYGDRWAPVMVAFVTSKQDPEMSDDVIGDTVPESVRADGGDWVYVSGEVYFDRSFVTDSLRDGATADVRATMLHELAHLVGLDHVNNAAMLMNPDAVDGVTDFAPQEKVGLRSVGSGACHPDV